MIIMIAIYTFIKTWCVLQFVNVLTYLEIGFTKS